MKKVFFTLTAMILTFGAFAQTETENKPTTQDKTAQKQHRHANGYMLKDGRVMMVKDGNLTPIQKDITLSNGTVIMADGNYMEKGKTKTKFKDGQHVDMNGNWSTSTAK